VVQNAVVFQIYASLSKSLNTTKEDEPPSYTNVALAGVGAGSIQTLLLCPVELLKIRLQLTSGPNIGPVTMAKDIFNKEGFRGIYRGLTVTILRDAPSHGVYFWTYEYTREWLHPGCRKTGEESLSTMLFSGGLAGTVSHSLSGSVGYLFNPRSFDSVVYTTGTC
jgi:solute carrier family 25 (mitochondrial carnitine/acylcarnitine transporter), member 20/29